MPDIAEKLGHYIWLANHVTTKIHGRPDVEEQYNVEYKAWIERQVLIPPKDDEEKRKAYFAFCDKICAMKPTTTGEHLRIAFACNAAMQVIIDQDICALSETECDIVLPRAIAYAESRDAQHQKNNTFATTSSSATSLPSGNLLEHLRDQFDPEFTRVIGSSEQLLGQVIRYRNAAGKVKECTVLDYGTSRIKGKWFSIAHNLDGSDEMMISASDMEHILACRIRK